MTTHHEHHHTAAVALGSNLGDRRAHITHGAFALASLPATSLHAISDIIQSDPVGPIPQPDYLNAAAILHTLLGPRELLDAMLDIERQQGRDRAAATRWGPRTLDLDLLLYDDLVSADPDLTIPHPRMHERLFVLQPLAQIAPHIRHPLLARCALELLLDLPPQ